MVVRGRSDDTEQDAASFRAEAGDDSELKEGAQGPWKPVPAPAATVLTTPVQEPEPGMSHSLLSLL